jgi:RecB family exonuclease
VKYFYANSIYGSSKTLYDELKRLSENLYIVTASYKDKRKLSPSIIIDKDIKESFNISDIQSRGDVVKSGKKIECEELKEYQESIISKEFSTYDGANLGSFSNGDKLSASALNTYAKCPLQYYFSYILRLNAPKDEIEGFDAAQRGSYMHLCFEMFVKEIKKQKLQSLDKKSLYSLMKQISEEAYKSDEIQGLIKEENINHIIEKTVLQNGLDDIESQNKAELAKFVDYFVENEFDFFQNSNAEELFMLDDNFKPIDLETLSEEKIQQIDKEKRFIKGFIDRLDNLKDGVNIIDYKSSVGSKNKKDFTKENLKDYQLGLYMLYATQKYPNRKEYNAHLLSFKDGDSKPLQYYDTSISLSTKNHYDDEYEKTLKTQIKTIQKQINSGEFAFNNSDETVCKWCNFTHICHQNVLTKENSHEN